MANMTGQRKSSAVTSTELSRYFVASLFALVVDVGLLILLAQVFAMPYLVANVFAFISGSIVAYLVSTRWVFENRRLDNKALEYLIFVFIGVLGLGVNEATLWMGTEILFWSLLPAKLLAAGFSFLFNFVVRKIMLFK